ncbi:peptidoglycan DD-metalloendopeptidase family protein [Epidermidibacterium keratini]|uniref:Peptidoglycan DD-metalloendopeptidase family protein n=1 Tax=Epidermidibacterium keratini TaxID=1891644 RepID=A0A7L4YTK6_9ACTN|nr:M23 family metallopeptidase [Epidermidibacterium keratini]QHC01857.1 peptidoglycan DD-metalloendopeptidase family protein [Epidermidibacterium keratini]
MPRYRPLAWSTIAALVVTLLLLWLAPAQAAPQVSTSWSWPLTPPQVTRYFDPPAVKWGAGHRGVDLAGGAGQPVSAAGDGTVAFVGMVAGRPVISIDHPSGLRTTYEPVASTLTAGATVSEGQQIGVLDAGHAGCPVAACLHWGVRRGETYLNPLILLGLLEVRLLPLAD